MSNTHLIIPVYSPSLTLAQRNRAQAFAAARDRRSKRATENRNRKNIQARGRESSELG